MRQIRQVAYAIIIGLIIIGDCIDALFSVVFSLIKAIIRIGITPIRYTLSHLPATQVSQNKAVKFSKKKTLYKAKHIPLFVRFLQDVGSLVKSLIVSIIGGLAQIIRHVVGGTKTFFSERANDVRSFVGGVKRIGRKVFVRKKEIKTYRSSRIVRTASYRPSLLYKLKYVFVGVFFSCIFIFMPLVALIFISDLPTPNNLSMNFIPKTTKIYDRNGNLLYEIFANQNRTVVKLDEIPVFVRQATIAIEDKDFYYHPGFDVRGITRAFISNMQNNALQGGSTITQQLIKSALLSSEPTINRKLREVVLAFWSERVYSKNQILEMYFNYVPYGGSAWGIEAASEIYFGKPVNQLTLAQGAFLAGLPRAPSIYSPYSGNGDVWKKRQKEVLQAMVRDNYITQETANEALSEKLVFQNPDTPIKAPHFVMYVKDLLVRKYGLSEVERGGLRVVTSLDLNTQRMAEEAVALQVEEDAYLNIQNGAAMITDPKNGDILAMVGSKDYFDRENDGNVNVTTSLRQPGSTVKLITYTLALSSGFTEATTLEDTPLVIPSPDGGPSYAPVNYDGTFRGRVPLRMAFANSLNIPAVRTAQKMGVDNIVAFGKKMGITSWGSPKRYGLAITLGSGETTMVDLATSYGTVANNGQKIELDPILEITNSDGSKVYTKQPKPEQVIDPGVAFIVSDILADNSARNMAFGSNSPLHIPGHRVSVKTGTTDNKRDNWTVGYSSDFVVATWVGNNDNTPMSQALASGITGAAPMWNKIMTNLIADRPSDRIVIPGDIVVKSCFGRTAYFLRGTEHSACRNISTGPTPSVSRPQSF